MSEHPAASSGTPAKEKPPPPQQVVADFWAKFSIEQPGRVTRILPPSSHAKLLKKEISNGPTLGNVKTTLGYEAARDECRKKVQRIANECRRLNEKWSDPDFNLESDEDNCLHGLIDNDSPRGPSVDVYDLRNALRVLNSAPNLLAPLETISLPALGNILEREPHKDSSYPQSVHRVDFIFNKPQFTIDGFGTSDVQQGQLGDCWWVASAAALCNVDGHMDKICVARDEECGVYGFVFFRDGEWISTVVDDNLCLNSVDFDDAYSAAYDPSGKKAKKWKEQNQTGSEALFYASCEDSNETWLPLLEKAYAKIHGDYAATESGWAGEGVEDMSGGIATTINLNRILSKERLWQELLRANKDFIFTISTPGAEGGDSDSRNGLTSQHAYTVLEAVEHENPWGLRDPTGKGEWDGSWSDGSKEWTPYWMEKLKHKFGDDGVFYISFEDMLKRFNLLDRVRLFNGDDWYISQWWTSVTVPWMATYLDDSKFVVDVTEPGIVVFALSQLDERYYQGLEGQYSFDLHFLLRQAGSDDHIALAGSELRARSVSAELQLEPGKYEVVPKIVAYRNKDDDLVEETVKKAAESNPRKLQQIGLNYDRAHLKATQWNPISETSKDPKSTPTQESKTSEQPTDEKVVARLETLAISSSQGVTATESTDAGPVQTDTTKDDEVRREQPPGTSAVGSVATQRDEPQLDVPLGPEGEGEGDRDYDHDHHDHDHDHGPDNIEQQPKTEDQPDEAKHAAGPWNASDFGGALSPIGLKPFI
ncbi:Calpain-9 [Diaporthe amygdali]|uniref:Calpain-9 n=1 Tax=Phomopsis amygdali TaxID=1214568 RepID=UPI0022FEF0E7|nr:Calpain-9 [Diaporthe amygdali]KAJ0116929.1 Calpain-9 [Diaporthe amygdali]